MNLRRETRNSLYTPITEDAQFNVSESIENQDIYTPDLPRDYTPHGGFMELPNSEYTPYDGHIAESLSKTDPGCILPPAKDDNSLFEVQALPGIEDLGNTLFQLQNLLPEDHSDVLRLSAAVQEMYNSTPTLPPPEHFDVELSPIPVHDDTAANDPVAALDSGSLDDIVAMHHMMHAGF